MYFPIGDVHGCYNELKVLYDMIVEEIGCACDPDHGGTIVFLGDYVDRGPDSKKVLDFLMGLEDFEVNGFPVKHIILKGNHEELMIHSCGKVSIPEARNIWLQHGGVQTLESFDVSTDLLYEDGVSVLRKYTEWLEELPVIAHNDHYIFVHAGIESDRGPDEQDSDDCMWFANSKKDAYTNLDRIVIHGHVPRVGGPIQDLDNNRIWMDVHTLRTGIISTIRLPEVYDGSKEFIVMSTPAISPLLVGNPSSFV